MHSPSPPTQGSPPSLTPPVLTGGGGSRRRRREKRAGRVGEGSEIRSEDTREFESLEEEIPGDEMSVDNVLLERLGELESTISEKDQLVTALTVQLEEAAERLDRLQRLGNDRGTGRGGGIPREMVEEQRGLSENLQRLMQEWDETQASAAFGRIEMQLEELRALVVGNVLGASALPEQAEQESKEESNAASWEAMKAGLLSESVLSDDEPEDDDDQEASRVHAPSVDLEADVELIDAPEDIDASEASVEDLRRAVETRDEYVACLIRKLRWSESRRLSVEAFGGEEYTPPEIRQRLEELENLVVEQQRLTEVELSLERARLAREEARVKHLEEALQKELKRLGLAQSPATEPPRNESPKSRRWRRILGITREEGDG